MSIIQLCSPKRITYSAPSPLLIFHIVLAFYLKNGGSGCLCVCLCIYVWVVVVETSGGTQGETECKHSMSNEIMTEI